MPKKNSPEVNLLKKITKEESIDCFINYNVEFDFHGYDGDVETVYVREHISSPNSVEFYMLENLEKRIREVNHRYQVGILYTEKSQEAEDFNELEL